MSLRIPARRHEKVLFALLPVPRPSGDEQGGGPASSTSEQDPLSFRFRPDMTLAIRSAIGELDRAAIHAAKNPTETRPARYSCIVLGRGSFRALHVDADTVNPRAGPSEVAASMGELVPPARSEASAPVSAELGAHRTESEGEAEPS